MSAILSERESLLEASRFRAKAEANMRERQRQRVIEEATERYSKRAVTTEDAMMVERKSMKGDGRRMCWTFEALARFDTSKEL